MKHLLSLLAVVLLGACSGGDDGARPAAGQGRDPLQPLPECPDADYSACDIAEAACQTRMMALAACLRETDPLDDLTIELISQAEYASILERDYEGSAEPEVNHFAEALAVLNLASAQGSRADGIAAYVEFAWGAYRAKEKRIVMVDHGEPSDSVNVDAVLVHEMVHALQDADYDLTSWPGFATATLDAQLATSSVIEGEARFYQFRVAAPMLGLDIDTVDFEAVMQEQLDVTLDEVFESPGYGNSYTTFPYGLGAVQAFHTWQKDGPRGIDRLYASPPTSTWQVMAPLFGAEETEIDVAEIAEPELELLTFVTEDILGAWGLNLFLASNNVERESSLPIALAWRGDHLWVYADETNQRTHALWQIELASAEEAGKVDHAMPDLLANVVHGTSGSRVFVSCSAGQGSGTPLAELTAWGEAWLVEQ